VRSPGLARRGPTVALVLVCLALGGVSAIELRHVSVTHGIPLSWSAILASTLPRWVWLAATLPVALRLGTRRIATHVVLFFFISAVHAAVTAWTIAFINTPSLFFPWPARLMRAFYNTLPITVSLYGAVLAVAWALNEARERQVRSLRASQLEAQLQTARLDALRAQLQPHFLYNTLNSIVALVVDSRATEAVAAIEQLSELLRASLHDDARSVIPLREEVALAERYLALQRMRFGERLRHEIALPPQLAECSVPVMLLQPLVENAVVHGLEAGQLRLKVAIIATATGDDIELRIENDGAGLADASNADGHGVGLAGTRARLATAYGDRASLELFPRSGGGVVVRLLLPRSNTLRFADVS
jgi:two-component system LytT family sensor kinase